MLDFALAAEPVGNGTGSVKGTVKDQTGAKLSPALVVADLESDMTNKGGKYMIGGVLEGSRDVTASFLDCAPKTLPVTVVAGQTLTVDFTGANALDCSP